MGNAGAVAWMFDKVGLVEGSKAGDFDPEEEAIEAGADDVEAGADEGVFSFYCDTAEVSNVRNALTERGWEITVAELSYKNKTVTELNDDQMADVVAFLEALDDNEDSHRIHATV